MAGASLGGMSGMHAQGDLPIPNIDHIEQPYFFELGKDGETKITIQQKGHSAIPDGAPITVGIEPNALREAFDDGVVTKQVIADEEEFKANGFQGVPAMLIGEKNFSPKSFMPVTGYTNIDELEKLIPSRTLSS